MPELSSLLELQDVDLASDALIEKRRTLPEREESVQCQQQGVALDEALGLLDGRRGELRMAEAALSDEVTTVSDKAREVEDTLYSGTVTSSKELENLQVEVRLLREKQGALEENELELMEQIEGVESEIQANRAARATSDDRLKALFAAIEAAEGKIDAELTVFSASRVDLAGNVPAPVMTKYDALRSNARLKGRAAALLDEGTCQACHIKLPVLEHKKIQSQPPDALVHCTQCRRILVR